jgi:protein-L-isoaspartate(D-aspartate) O-methyltransferase
MQDFKLARRAMVDSQLRPEGVTNRAVLAAMGTVAREDYVPSAARAFAYFDRSIALDDGTSLMPPAALGRLLSELDPQPGERALVIGGGGYSAALLEAVGLSVTAKSPADALASGKPKASVDLLLFDGAVDHIPDALVARLAPGGRIGAAIVDRGVTRLAIARLANGQPAWRTIGDAAVSPLAGFDRPPVFTF